MAEDQDNPAAPDTASTDRDDVFKVTRKTPQNRAEATDQAARAILKAEADARHSQTRRLREARLAREAAAPPDPSPAPVRKPRKTPNFRRV